jgi:hypothetical protein
MFQKLPPAFFRPGRIDICKNIGYANDQMIVEYLKNFFFQIEKRTINEDIDDFSLMFKIPSDKKNLQKLYSTFTNSINKYINSNKQSTNNTNEEEFINELTVQIDVDWNNKNELIDIMIKKMVSMWIYINPNITISDVQNVCLIWTMYPCLFFCNPTILCDTDRLKINENIYDTLKDIFNIKSKQQAVQ